MEETNESPASASAQAKRDAELEELRQRNLASTTKDQLNLDGSSQPITKEAFLELQKQQILLTKQKQAEAQNLLKEYRNKDLNIKQTDEYKLKQQEAQNMLHSYRGDTDSLTSYQVKKISKKDNYVPNVGSSGQLETMNEKTDDDDDFFASLDNEFMPSPAKDEDDIESKPRDAQTDSKEEDSDAPAEVSDDDNIDNINSLSFGQDDIIKKPSESSNENSTESWVDINSQEKNKVEDTVQEDTENINTEKEVEGYEEKTAKDQEESNENTEQQEKDNALDEKEKQRIAAEQEAARIAEEERIRAEQEAARIAEEERIAAEQEAARIAEEQRIAAEQEAEAARIAEEERIRAEQEAARIAEEERIAAEQEAARIAEEQRIAADQEAARIAEEERIKAEQQEAEASRIAEEQRIAAEQEAEAARIAEEQRIAAEQEAEAARIAEEQRIAAEQEAARIAEEERIKAEQEAARWSDKYVSISFSYLTDDELSVDSKIIQSTVDHMKSLLPELLKEYTTNGEIEITNAKYDIFVSRDALYTPPVNRSFVIRTMVKVKIPLRVVNNIEFESVANAVRVSLKNAII